MTLKLIPKLQPPQVQPPQVQTPQVETPAVKPAIKVTGKRKTVQFDVPSQPQTKSFVASSATPSTTVPSATVPSTVKPSTSVMPLPSVKPIVVDEVAKRQNKFSQNKLLPYNREMLTTLIPTCDNKFPPVQLLVSLNGTFASQPYTYKNVVYHVVDLSDSPASSKPCNLVLLVNETFGKFMNSSAIQNVCRDLDLGQDMLKVNVNHKNYTTSRRCVTGRGLVNVVTRPVLIDNAVEPLDCNAKTPLVSAVDFRPDVPDTTPLSALMRLANLILLVLTIIKMPTRHSP
jgi:hypothetical protein